MRINNWFVHNVIIIVTSRNEGTVKHWHNDATQTSPLRSESLHNLLETKQVLTHELVPACTSVFISLYQT